MKKILFTLAVLIFISYSFRGKNSTPRNGLLENATFLKVKPKSFIKELPGQLRENSGIIFYDDLLWTFNDSGGENKIFGFDFSGKIKKEIEIEDARNIDWEDIAQDKKYIYIGDFGNNSGKRKNLKIYRIKKKDIGEKKKQKLYSKEIKFNFENQKSFDFKRGKNPFDCEAMAELDGNLYIFTKDRSDYTTTVYQIPKKKGKYEISPIEKFDMKGLITGADISPDKNTLALIGYRNDKPILWLFSNFTSDSFFDGKKTFIELNTILNAQTEGICYMGNDSLLISCEQTKIFKQQVFLIDLKTLE